MRAGLDFVLETEQNCWLSRCYVLLIAGGIVLAVVVIVVGFAALSGLENKLLRR